MTSESWFQSVAPAETAKQRLDRWLADQLADAISSTSADPNSTMSDQTEASITPYSRSRIKALILDGCLEQDGEIQRDPAVALRPGAVYRLKLPEAKNTALEAEDIPLTILHEDEHLIVLDKPAGMVVHPAPGHASGTLVHALLGHCGPSLTGIGGCRRPGIVHRLDKDTSGVMLAAKTEVAHQKLTAAFAAHDLERVYTALAWGVLSPPAGLVNAPIGRSTSNRKKMAIYPEGSAKARQARTHYSTIRLLPPLASLVECRLETGRTHQIRVHMASLGHGIIGDPTYGRGIRKAQLRDSRLVDGLETLRGFPRQALHATKLALSHPIDGTILEFTTEPPADMQVLIQTLERQLSGN